MGGSVACARSHFLAGRRRNVVAASRQQAEQPQHNEDADCAATVNQDVVQGGAAFSGLPCTARGLIREGSAGASNEHDHKRKRDAKHASRSPHSAYPSHPYAWGVPHLDIEWKLPEGKAYDWFVATPGAIILIIVVGLVFRWFIRRAVDRLVAHAIKGAVPGVIANTKAGEFLAELRPEAYQRRQQRATAMGSLLKSASTGLIFAVVGVMVLSKLGVDVAPIIASAGIVGVALGFGAQNLVKDFLAGIFMILEDQYGVGDVVDLGLASGTVEAVGLRVTRLRDVNGTVWHVRNGEVLRVGNQSQNWSRTVLDITVAYDSDLTLVQRVLQEEANALADDPHFADVVIEAPEVWGVERFDKDGPVVRVVLKTAPMKQWVVARAMRQRIKSRFDAERINMPTSLRTTTEQDPA
jgi:small-conductance mechanosensitive channel